VIRNAYKAFAIANPINGQPPILVSNASQIQTYVFNKLNGPNGSVYSERAFLSYMQSGFSPYDGTTSTAPQVGTVIPWSISNYLVFGGEVRDVFASGTTAAATERGRAPLTVFFNPTKFDPSNYGANVPNMGTLFHEALHGFTGQDDPTLQSNLGCVVHNEPGGSSENITDYLEQFLASPQPLPGNIQKCDFWP
jgi:hypothetical protein